MPAGAAGELVNVDRPAQEPESQEQEPGWLEMYKLLFDNHGGVGESSRPAVGSECLYCRNAPNTADIVELGRM
eukprot:3022347-Rhodomonas_salina.1